jgi:protein FrlC
MRENADLIGVSPAYFISRCGDRFTPYDVAEGLTDVAQLGYNGFQLEVFNGEYLRDWVEEGAKRVRRRSSELGLVATQFVAHFMMEAFADPERINSDLGIDEMQSVLEIVDLFEECRLITIPLGTFESLPIHTTHEHQALYHRCLEKLAQLLELVESSGRKLALEILPKAFIGGIDGFLRLGDQLGTDSLGLNFDTGHAWAAKENLYLVPAKLGRRILGTHLCDNCGNENLSLRPGTGSIDWKRLLAALKHIGYAGWLDLEIICKPDEVRREYDAGHKFVRKIWDT